MASNSDTDADGIPDEAEQALGLNPNNPTDALEDPDFDGLSNKDEFQRGTDLRNPDTDNDGLKDGDEVLRGTNPLLPDTDNDGIPDGLEVQLGTNPLDPASVNLSAALNGITATPPAVTLTVNNITPEASVQLAVRGALRDNSTIDLTPTSRGTTYTSSNLTICNFGAQPGRVFAGSPGTCIITVRNSGFEAQVPITVQNFTPTPLSSFPILGAIAIDVVGGLSYVAGGANGLHIVNTGNRSAPVLLKTIPLPGTARDVRVSGNFAYVAAGAAGLHIVNISNSATAALVNTVDTPGDAQDVAVRNGRAYIADGASGLHIIDVVVPAAARILGTINPGANAAGVDIDPSRNIAGVAMGTSGLRLIDVSNPSAPVLRGILPGGNVSDVILRGTAAYLADTSRSFTSVDTSNVNAPVLTASLPAQFGGLLFDVAAAGTFAFGADIFFVNGTPVIDISSPLAPAARAILNFPGDATGTGIAADSQYVYLIADNVLYIGQHQALNDTGTVPPTVSIVSPTPNSTVIARSTIPVTVNATDDVEVAAVSLLVNGTPVLTKASPPWEFNLVVPHQSPQFTLAARAVDLAGNIGNSAAITLNTIVGPLTTVTGRSIDRQGNPVPNAAVNVVNEFTATGATDGRFNILNVPAAINPLRAFGQATVNSVVLRGRSNATATTAGGITNVGDVVYFPDADWDGLPDDFEAAYPCLAAPGADAEADTDFDGQTNYQEYLAGTNPCVGNLPPGTREVIGPLFSLLNGTGPTTLPEGQNEAVSPLFSLLNQLPDISLPSGQNEAISPLFSLLNGPAVLPIPAGQSEAISPLFSLLNGLPPSTLSPGQNETFSPLFSLRNGDLPVLLPGQSESISPLFSLRNGPTAPITIPDLTTTGQQTSPTADQPPSLSTGGETWTAGDTVELRASGPAATVRYFADGVTLGEAAGSAAFPLVAPAGVDKVQIRAVAHDGSGHPLWAQDRMISIQPTTTRTLEGRLLQANGRPASNRPVRLYLEGLTAEWFDFQQSLTTLPDLTDRTPDATHIASSLTYRNPERIFGGDPFGTGMSPDFAMRFRGWILIDKPGEYRFALQSFESARLSIDGKLVAETRTPGAVELTTGAHPVEIDYYTTVGAPELIWSFAAPGDTQFQPVPASMLRTRIEATSSRDGRVSIPGLPAGLRNIYRGVESTNPPLPLRLDGAVIRTDDISLQDEEVRQ